MFDHLRFRPFGRDAGWSSVIFARNFASALSLGADATFSRSTVATYVGSDGLIHSAAANEPRFEYSGGVCQGLLMEPQRTNYVLNSEDITGWADAVHTISASSVVAPDGGIAYQVIYDNPSADSSGKAFASSLTPSIGDTVVGRVWLGGVSGYPTSAYFGFYDDSSFGSVADCTAKIISGPGTLSKTELPFSVSGLSTSELTLVELTRVADRAQNYSFAIYPNTAAFTTTGGNIVWGASMELGDVATSYIPTTGTAATRNADALSYSGIPASNETRAVVDGANADADDWDGIVDATLLGADNLGQVASITVYKPGARPA